MTDAAQLDLYIVPYPATPDLAAYASDLDPTELARADRFHFPHLRNFYLFSHAALRRILSTYTQTSPHEIAFAYGRNGKPFLPAYPDLHFNASHSGDLFVCAIQYKGQGTRDKGGLDLLIAKDPKNADAKNARQGNRSKEIQTPLSLVPYPSSSIGVDVEQLRPLSPADLASIPKHFFAPAEQARLAALPADQQQRAFFECWTRKEAVIKATGEGVSRPLDSFEVAFGPDTAPALLRLDDDLAPQWQIASLEPAPGFVAAVASPHRWQSLIIRTLPELGIRDKG